MSYKDKEKERAYQQEWYEANKEKAKANSHAWYQANKARHRSLCKKWAASNRDKVAGYVRSYRERHGERVRQDSRDARLLRLYGITSAEYEKLELDQGGTCAICNKPPNGRPLSVDHNHKTGEVRGLLCDLCNWAIGHLDEDPIRARSLADYLEKYSK